MSHQSPSTQNRRAQFVEPPSRTGGVPTAVLIAVGMIFLGSLAFAIMRGSGSEASPYAPGAIAAGADVELDASQFDDGRARFFRYTSATGREVRFFVMKSADGVVRAAFDACDECFREKKGYRQQGDEMVCVNCGQSFHSSRINVVKGGCNPSPIDREVDGDRIVLRAASLEQGVPLF